MIELNIVEDKEILGAIVSMAIMANETDLVDAEMNIEEEGMKYTVSNTYDTDKLGFNVITSKVDKTAHAILTTSGELKFEGDKEVFLEVAREATLAW